MCSLTSYRLTQLNYPIEPILFQMYGHSGIMSFYHKGGLEESKKLLQELKMITLAESLGGYESLAELPYLVFLNYGLNSISLIRLP